MQEARETGEDADLKAAVDGMLARVGDAGAAELTEMINEVDLAIATDSTDAPSKEALDRAGPSGATPFRAHGT